MAHTHPLERKLPADLIRAMLRPQPFPDEILRLFSQRPGTRLFRALTLLYEAFGLNIAVASCSAIMRKLLGYRRLAESHSATDQLLAASRLLHVADHLSFCRSEAAVFFIHRQFVVKPD